MLLFCLLFPSLSIFSQEDTTTVKELLKLRFDELMNLPVSSASKIEQKISEAPSIVSIISRDQINKYQWTSLNDIAYKQAGFSPAQDRFNHVIVSRGIYDLLWSKRLLVLFDGVPFSSFQSTVTNEALSLNMAKSVEIVRGPGAVLYGSQAVTGVLQVNSLSYSDLKGSGEVEVKGGDYGQRNVNVLVGAKGRKANMLVSFNNFHTNGNEYNSYDAFLKEDAQGNYIKHRTQDERSSNHFWTKIEGKDKLQGLSLSYHFQNYNFQMGHGFLTIFPEREATSYVTRNYILAKYISPRSTKRLVHEYVLKYDYEVSEMNMQIAPVGFKRLLSTGKIDSAGIWEQYVVPINSGFARTQWIYFFDNKITLMGGLEQDLVYYSGDKLHYSNVNLNSDTSGLLPFPNGELRTIKPLYEPIKNHPVNNTGIYAQLTSGTLFGNKLTATLGARYDMYYYEYKDLTTQVNSNRFLTHISPRIVLVYAPKEDLSLKAIYGNAFRVASPFEQFIANSIVTGLARKNIDPEEINSFELSADWTFRKRMNWRNTLFYSIFKDQIRSSKGAFTNVIGTTQQGIESELNFYFNDFHAFVNYSFAQRVKETSTDTLVKTSNSLIWYPAHSANVGISYRYEKVEFTAQGHYQSEVDRRSSEKGAPKAGATQGVDYDELRGGSKVKAWYTLDLNMNYHITNQLEARLIVTNALNNRYNLINNLGGSSPQPFDYQQERRRIMISMKMNF